MCGNCNARVLKILGVVYNSRMSKDKLTVKDVRKSLLGRVFWVARAIQLQALRGGVQHDSSARFETIIEASQAAGATLRQIRRKVGEATQEVAEKYHIDD